MDDVATSHVPARRRLHLLLEPSAWPRLGLSPLNKLIAALILISVATTVLESEPTISQGRETIFLMIEITFTIVFLIEYLLRVWVSVEDPRYHDGVLGRFRYMRSPAAIMDLLALAPLAITFVGTEAFLFRLVRLIRILRLAKLGRYSSAMRAITDAVRSRRHELAMSVCIAGLLLLVTSTLLHLVEGHIQPEKFGSIPRAMWWSISTLTTVGYGDVFPVTAVGRLLAGLTAITGIGLIAMPTGILAAAFSEAMAKRRMRNGADQRQSDA